VKWFKDGKQLSSSKTVHMESKGKSRQLVLENVEKKDVGEYTCEVGNEKLLFKIQVTGMEISLCLSVGLLFYFRFFFFKEDTTITIQ